MEQLLNEEANGTIALKNASFNATDVLNAMHELFSSKRGELAKIEIYVCLTASVLALIVVLGSFRRRCGHRTSFRQCVWAATAVSYGLISYTMGLMTSASFHHELFAVWGVFLLVILGRADSLTAYSLQDNEKRSWFAWKMGLQVFWSAWLIHRYAHGAKFEIPLWCLWAISVVRNYEKLKANESASKKFGVERGVKRIADFMSCEDRIGTEEERRNYDPTTMKGYHYLVYGEEDALVYEDEEKALDHGEEEPILGMENYQYWHLNMEKVVTVEKVWQCGGLLGQTGDQDGRLKDICLSFALFKLLRRRFAGYLLYEAKLEKTRRFVKDGLLMKEGDHREYERAWRVIEVELAFLYDFFYTKYPVIFARGFPAYKVIELMVVFIGSWIAVSTLGHYHPAKERTVNLILFQLNIDVYVTRAIIFVIVVVELFELMQELFSDWNKVVLLCNYVKRSSWQKSIVMVWIIKLFCTKPLFSRFGRKVQQYSFLESFDHTPRMICLNSFLSKFINVRREGQCYSQKDLPEEVGGALVHFLSDILSRNQNTTNGKASLLRNSTKNGGSLDDQLVEHFLHRCEFETHVEGIMVWHIATCLCEFVYLMDQNSKAEDVQEYYLIADCLSKYCAYLVAFVPELLPDQADVTRTTFHQTVLHATKGIGKGRTTEDKFSKLWNGKFSHILKKGAKLGTELVEKVEQRKLWKVLADFWVEKMLFIAPSENAIAHVEKLAAGGECVTVLWALLNHAGIVKPNSPTSDGPVRTTLATHFWQSDV